MDITLADLHSLITEFQSVVTTRLDSLDRRMTNIERDIAVVRDDLHAVFPAFAHTDRQVTEIKREMITQGLTHDRGLADLKGEVAQYRLDVVNMQENLQVLVKMEMTNVANTLSSRLDSTESRNQQRLAEAAASIFSPSIKTFEEFQENAAQQVQLWSSS